MTEFQKSVIALIRRGLSEKTAEPYAPCDYDKLYSFAKFHQITCLVYRGLCGDEAFVSSPAYARWTNLFYFLFSHSEKQLYETSRVCRAFEEAGVDYMPLKGCLLKRMYPETYLREMGDSDILIRLCDYGEKIKPVMSALGFTERLESAHEFVWELPQENLSLELHKSLIPDYNKDFYAYFGTGWDKCAPVAEGLHEYAFSAEDEFIFLFTHFAKHYRDAGAGVKYVVDFYVYFRNHPSLNFEYIQNELQKLQLNVFFQNVQKLIGVWFNGEEPDETTDFLTQKIFASGVYGAADKTLSAGLKQSKKSKNYRFLYAVKVIFPPYSSMKQKYGILNKLPFLLPFCWVARWFTVLFRRPKQIGKQIDGIKKMKKENIDRYRAELNAVGLDYNFK